jgi:hypothetical protein
LSYIFEYQPASNNRFWPNRQQRTTGIVIHSIGVPQPRAQVIVNNFNRQTATASVHGVIEPGRYIETYPTRLAPNLAQRCGHVGSGRNGTWNDTRLGFEMTEPSTITYTGGASFRDNNPTETKKFFQAVTATMAEVAADMCIFHGWSVSMISTHREAHALGWGSNHGDPCHLWRHIGYSIEQFRKDVQFIINEKKGDYLTNMTKEQFQEILAAEFDKRMPVYRLISDVPAWARPTIEKMIELGHLQGVGLTQHGERILNLSSDLTRTFVLMARTGAFDEKCKHTAITSCDCAEV